MNTYFILGVVLAFAAFANTEEEQKPSNNREARLFGGGWGWGKRPAVETVFITYPKKGWGWKSGGHHGPSINIYGGGGHGHGGGGGGGGWGWGWPQPQKHIHLPGGHFEAPGWGWEGGHGYSKKAAKAHKKAQKKGYGGGHGGHGGGGGWGWQQPQQQGWGWQDPWQGWERSDVPTSAEISSARILPGSEESGEAPYAYSGEVPYAYNPEYAQQYGDDYY